MARAVDDGLGLGRRDEIGAPRWVQRMKSGEEQRLLQGPRDDARRRSGEVDEVAQSRSL